MSEQEVGSKNAALLAEFSRFCERHPEQRFWQALRNWSGQGFIYASQHGPLVLDIKAIGRYMYDTFFWEEKDGTHRKKT